MPYCDKCRVEVPGDRRRCPLCQGQLPPGGDPQAEVFPVVPTVYRQHHLVIRIFIFLSIAAGVICVACNFLFTPTDGGRYSSSQASDVCGSAFQARFAAAIICPKISCGRCSGSR